MIKQRDGIPEFYDLDEYPHHTILRHLQEIKGGFSNINLGVRNGHETDDAMLSYIIKSSPMLENAVLYRGCGPYDFGVEFASMQSEEFLDIFFKKGDYFTIPIYPNTSLDKNIALKFARQDGRILFKINAPKGTSGVYMENLPNMEEIGNEEEIILDKNLIYKFKKRTKFFGYNLVEIDVVPNPKRGATIHNFAKEVSF